MKYFIKNFRYRAIAKSSILVRSYTISHQQATRSVIIASDYQSKVPHRECIEYLVNPPVSVRISER